jgi:hypothetical protein
MTDRRVAVGLVLVALVVSTGCIGFLTGDEALTFDSSPVGVSDAAQEETGYEEVRRDTENVTREYEVADQTREVEVRNHVAEYARTVSIPGGGEQEFSRFTVLSTPRVVIAGQGPFNPADEWNNTELVLRVQQEYDEIENIREEGERNRTVLGEETRVSEFRADAKAGDGVTVEVIIHVTKLQHGDDFVVAIGVHPAELDEEREHVNTMLDGIEHETDS